MQFSLSESVVLAETWAHYLQMIDGLETGAQLGIPMAASTGRSFAQASCRLPAVMASGMQVEDTAFEQLLRRWLDLVMVMNEASRSFGAPLLYPYIIPPAAMRKLRLAHHFAGLWG